MQNATETQIYIMVFDIVHSNDKTEPVQDPAKTLQIANTTHATLCHAMLPSLLLFLAANDERCAATPP